MTPYTRSRGSLFRKRQHPTALIMQKVPLLLGSGLFLLLLPVSRSKATEISARIGGESLFNSQCAQEVPCRNLVINRDTCVRCNGTATTKVCVAFPGTSCTLSGGTAGECGAQVQCDKFFQHNGDCLWVPGDCNWQSCTSTGTNCEAKTCQ